MVSAHRKAIVGLLLGTATLAGAAAITVGTVGSAPTAPNAKAQTDSVRAAGDTLIREACRAGTLSASMLTCSGSNQAPRKEVVRRLAFRVRVLANRIDSLLAAVKPESVFVHDTVVVHDTVAAPIPPVYAPTCTIHTCYSVSYVMNSDSLWKFNTGVDSATVCAVLEGPGAATGKRLAWPPVRIYRRATDGTLLPGDSVRWGTRGGNALSQMCERAITMTGATADSIPVVWAAEWFPYRGQQIYRPQAAVP